jgi:hypothetical protein
MQQSGSAPSQPDGHVVQQPASVQQPGGPPKQRMIPAWSALQTSLFPLQQFCDALYPQMSPGGLHEPPLSQTCVSGVHSISCDGGTRSLMLQQASVESQ